MAGDNVMEQHWSPMRSSASEVDDESWDAEGQQCYGRPAGSLHNVVASIVRNGMQRVNYVSVSSFGPPEFLNPGRLQDVIPSTPCLNNTQTALDTSRCPEIWRPSRTGGTGDGAAAAAIAKAAATVQCSFNTPVQQAQRSNSLARTSQSAPDGNCMTPSVPKDRSSSWQHVLQWLDSQTTATGRAVDPPPD